MKKYKIKKCSEGTTISKRDIYGNPITANIKKDSKINRSYYDDRLNTMILGSDYNKFPKEVQDKVESHENYHAKQFNSGNSNFDIAHNTVNSTANKLRKKPSVTATDEEYYDYHNRKPIESKLDIQNFRKNNKNSEFVPDNVIFDKKIDGSQYNNPYSFEGEAAYYENRGKEFPKYKKGIKKITKAENGLSLTDDEGNLTQGAQQAGGLVSTVGAGLIEGSTASKYDSKYTSQLKDENQALGRGIGAAVGASTNLLVPGLGTIATPLLSSAGGAVQRNFQEDKLKKLKKQGDLQDNITKSNEKIGQDLTSFQAKQYANGSKKVKAPSNSSVSESTKHDTAYNNLPSFAKNQIDSTKEVKPKVSDKFLARGRAIDNAEYKGEFRNAMNAASYLRSVPTPITQSIGWGAAGIGAAMDAKDIYDSAKQGKTGEAIAGGILSATQLLPGGNVFSGMGLTGKAARGAMMLKGAKTFGEVTGIVGDSKQGEDEIKEAASAKYSKGTKVIEIEGKKTPEIHTDANFNIKNLGTTPHSKGGNKVLAEEGDVVFPTQNSEKKYNEIMTAIKNKDKYKLKQEQAKLPEDKNPKYSGGTRKVYIEGKGFVNLDDKEYADYQKNSLSAITNTINSNKGKSLYNDIPNLYTPTKVDKPVVKSNTPSIPKQAAKSRVVGKTVSKSSVPSNWKNPNTPMSLIDSKTPFSIPEKLDTLPVEKTEQSLAEGKDTSSNSPKSKFGLNDAAEVLPIAYNLGQGLFGKTEKVNRRQFTPELEKYTDLSGNARREANEVYKGALSNARNLSGGLASNVRANSQVAANQKLNQMNQIDSQEYGKQLDVANRNTNTLNNAKLTNLQLNNQYDDLDSQNRAKKSEALSTGLNDLGDLGYRNKFDANRLQTWKDTKALSAKGTSYKVDSDEDGTNTELNFDKATGIPLPSNNLLDNTKVKRKDKHEKGSKGIQVERKYKIK